MQHLLKESSKQQTVPPSQSHGSLGYLLRWQSRTTRSATTASAWPFLQVTSKPEMKTKMNVQFYIKVLNISGSFMSNVDVLIFKNQLDECFPSEDAQAPFTAAGLLAASLGRIGSDCRVFEESTKFCRESGR